MAQSGAHIFGRRVELEQLERAIAEARAGQARFVLLSGEPGVGKTTLALEAARRATEGGARVAFARAWEGAGAPAFWIWSELFRELGIERAVEPIGTGDEARFAALESIARQVRALATETFLVLVLDDLQWADVPSVHALKLLARTAHRERLCVIVTARSPSEASVDVSAVIGDLRREATALAIGGLERADLAELAHARGLHDDEAVDAIARATAGNALFAVEVLDDPDARSALAAGRPVPAPRGVRDVLSRHLARLTDHERDVIEWAAVAGEPIVPADIAAASGQSPAVVTGALDAACRHAIARVVGDTFRFAHDLFRTAAYDEIPRDRRAAKHESLGRLFGERDRASAARVFHLFAANPTTASVDAAQAAFDAARVAMDRLSYEEAASLLEKAALAYERAGERAGCTNALALLAEAYLLGGNADRWAAAADRAMIVARESTDAEAFARAAIATGLRRTVAAASGMLSALLEEALRRLDESVSSNDALRCAVEARLAAALQPSIDPTRALDLARRAIARARDMAEEDVLARTLDAARPAFRMLEPLAERVAMDRELLLLARRRRDDPLSAHALARVFWGALESGEVARADEALAELEGVSERLRLPQHEVAARAARCVRDLMRGRWNDAEAAIQVIDASRERWSAASSRVLPIDPVAILRMNVAFARGDASAIARPPGEPLALFALFLDARAGRFEEARSRLPAVAARSLSGEVAYATRIYLSDACVRVGAVEHAPKLYELLLPFAGRHVVWTPLPGYDGAVDRILGGLAALLGDRASAMRHYDAAIAMEEQAEATPFAVRSRTERLQLGAPSAGVVVGDPTTTRSHGVRPALVRDGDTWLVTYGAESARLKDSDGLRYLELLVARPQVPVPIVELFAARASARGETPLVTGDAGEVLDREAVQAYRERASDLRERLAEAEARNDRGTAEKARTELAFLEDEIARAVGLGGRSRRAGSDAERIRVNVTTRIRKTIERLAEHAPALARHLETSIRTGSLCSYEPR